MDEYHLTFEVFSAKFGSTPKEEFLAEFPDPFLIVDLKGDLDLPPDAQATDPPLQRGQLTAFEVSDVIAHPNTLVTPLLKTRRNAFQGGVTLGRTPNNDVVLPHKAVSKFHAFFAESKTTGQIEIQDVGSRYGTEVNGAPLPPGEGMALRTGSEILIAKYVKATFFLANDFYTYIHLMEHKKKTGLG